MTSKINAMQLSDSDEEYDAEDGARPRKLRAPKDAEADEMFEGKPFTSKQELVCGNGKFPTNRAFEQQASLMSEIQTWVDKAIKECENDDDELTRRFHSLVPASTIQPSVYAKDSCVSPNFTLDTALEYVSQQWMRFKIIIVFQGATGKFVGLHSTRCQCLYQKHVESNEECYLKHRSSDVAVTFVK